MEQWHGIRKRNRRKSFFAMLFLPAMATLVYSVVRQFYWQMSGVSWFLVYFAYSMHGMLYGVFTTQLVIWWHWRPKGSVSWRSGSSLLTAYLLGIYITTLWQTMSRVVELIPASLICLGYALAGIATHWFVVVAIGSVSVVHIIDPTNSNGKSTEPDSENELEEVTETEVPNEATLAVSQRRPFSIATLMFATLVSALIFVLLRWTREFYGASRFSGGYPESDAGQIAGLLSSAIANSFCMFAAVHWHRHRSILTPLILILVGLILSVLGRIVGMMSGGAWATALDSGMMLALVVDATGMLLIHAWLLKKWNQSGYQFI